MELDDQEIDGRETDPSWENYENTLTKIEENMNMWLSDIVSLNIEIAVSEVFLTPW